ncbi:LytR/AlgR family response regulator transcription factor [Elizabethkingia ursingii]|uniref:DNA-binding response regulator n=1 Tax=Elizabethkingia ursingii TaxID=1756150 RepID=A0ABX3NH60_9FLAO|nr:LytTR family DNA-binding domain-containing protein [Elizabethkingia ursingii]OPB94530.1 DNA-binding response regulator [Elizabethkingia ursingii]
MIKVLIVEDEEHNIEHLQDIIENSSFDISVVNILGSVQDVVSWLSTKPQLDLILMDIRLSDGNSFEIFDTINVDTPIIFTTAFDEYAITAFKVNSIDYLLKPIRKQELEQSLNKFTKLSSPHNNQDLLQRVSQLFNKKNYKTRFLINNSDRYVVLDTADIGYICTEFRRTKAFTLDKASHILPYTMEEIELSLNPDDFFRASRQYLITLKSIKLVKNNLYSRITVVLNDDIQIDLSRERSRALKIWLDQ